MKKTALTLLTGLALAATAQAGEDYAPPAPIPEPCLWTWFAGGSYGYVDDIDNDLWSLHVGAEYRCPQTDGTHAFYLEVGVTDWDDSERYYDYQYDQRFKVDYDFSIVPITINYKYEAPLAGPLNWYIGGGLGIAISSIDIDAPGIDLDDSETAFYAQAAAGLVWNISDSFEIFGGVRYLYMDGNDEIDGFDVDAVLNDDWMYEIGARYNF